jgi:hypothetical protein
VFKDMMGLPARSSSQLLCTVSFKDTVMFS